MVWCTQNIDFGSRMDLLNNLTYPVIELQNKIGLDLNPNVLVTGL